MKSKSKIRRYRNLFTYFENWPQYLWFKTLGQQESFTFQLRNGFSVRVPRQMLSSFRECFFDRIYFSYIPEHLLELESPTIVDIGANVGYFSLFMFYEYPKATGYAFEPMPFNFQVLESYKKTHSNFDWHVYHQAVSDNSQPLTLRANNLDGYTTMASIFDKATNTESIEVETVTLPQFLEKEAIGAIDILKLDCEGSEYAILYTLPPKILSNVRILLIETH
ncbi:MAG: FkbM family methyltransferase [Tunicatimonas sp.]|uniref:FkbM family methyltransferase n=1 Tax=Tunicatimonas sp. TaxID=1940096 RepID=UPI003C75F653